MEYLEVLERLRKTVGEHVMMAKEDMITKTVANAYYKSSESSAEATAAEKKYGELMRTYIGLAVEITILQTRMVSEMAALANPDTANDNDEEPNNGEPDIPVNMV